MSPERARSKAWRLALNPDASPHANWPAQPPRFPEISGEDEDVLEENRCQSHHTPREAALYVECLATPRAGTPFPLPQAPIVATTQVDIDESLLK